MKRSEWEAKLKAAKDEAERLEESVRRDWRIGDRTCTVYFYDHRGEADTMFHCDPGGSVTAEQYPMLAKYRLAYEQWMANELDELPPSTWRVPQ